MILCKLQIWAKSVFSEDGAKFASMCYGLLVVLHSHSFFFNVSGFGKPPESNFLLLALMISIIFLIFCVHA